MDELATKRQLVKVQLQANTHADAIIQAISKTLNFTQEQHATFIKHIQGHIDQHPLQEDMVDIFIPKLDNL
jgi:hypothetical protein